MSNTNLPQDIFEYPLKEFSDMKRRLLSNRTRLLIILTILVVIFLNYYISMPPLVRIFKSAQPSEDSRVKVFVSLSITYLGIVSLCTLVISSLLSLIPYKNYRYSQKIWPVALLTLLVLELVILGILLFE
jgi:hypothetical protein